VVLPVAEEALVRDQNSTTEERGARRGVERNIGPVLAGACCRGELFDLLVVPADDPLGLDDAAVGGDDQPVVALVDPTYGGLQGDRVTQTSRQTERDQTRTAGVMAGLTDEHSD